jgi:hypothetical protein
MYQRSQVKNRIFLLYFSIAIIELFYREDQQSTQQAAYLKLGRAQMASGRYLTSNCPQIL